MMACFPSQAPELGPERLLCCVVAVMNHGKLLLGGAEIGDGFRTERGELMLVVSQHLAIE